MIQISGLGQDTGPEPEPRGEVPGSDVDAVSLPGVLTSDRGYIAVPTPDVRSYVQTLGFSFLSGLVIGVAFGGVFGNFIQQMQKRIKDE